MKQTKAVLQDELALLQRLSDDIILLTDEGEIITEVETAELISDSIRESLPKIQKVIGATETMTPTCPSTSRSSTPSAESTPKVKLPELTLRPFDNNYINWLIFWDTYKASVHDNADVIKLTYLTSLLRGSAKEAVAGLSLTSANYKEAVVVITHKSKPETWTHS